MLACLCTAVRSFQTPHLELEGVFEAPAVDAVVYCAITAGKSGTQHLDVQSHAIGSSSAVVCTAIYGRHDAKQRSLVLADWEGL